MLTTLLPTDDRRKRGWIHRSIRSELHRPVRGTFDTHAEAARTYRAVDRIGQLASLQDGVLVDREADLRYALNLSDLTAAFGRARSRAASLAAQRALGEAPDACEEALSSRDPALIRSAAARLHGSGAHAADAVATLAWAAKLAAAWHREHHALADGSA